jgi:hypothetical protein
MTTRFQMQAMSSTDGFLYSWLADTPDWTGGSYTGTGSPLDITLASGGFISPGGDSGDGDIVNASGAFLVNAGGAQLISARPSLVNASAANLINQAGFTLLVGH